MFSVRDMASHTRLKFRQPGQTTATEVGRRDLKLELLNAERASDARKAAGLPGFAGESAYSAMALIEAAVEDSESKRRKLLADVANLDADDDDDPVEPVSNDKGKGRATSVDLDAPNGDTPGEDDDDDESSDDDEDETAELLRELEKIKRERAEEKEKAVRPSAPRPVTLLTRRV